MYVCLLYIQLFVELSSKYIGLFTRIVYVYLQLFSVFYDVFWFAFVQLRDPAIEPMLKKKGLL